MGVVAKEGIKGTLVSYLGIGIAYITLIGILPYCLSVEENGLVRVFVEALAIFALIFQLGIPSAIVRFNTLHTEHEEKRQAFISLNLWASLAGIALMVLFGWALKDWIFDYFQKKSPTFNLYYIYLIPAAAFVILAAVFEKLSNTFLKITWPIFFRDVLTRILLAISVLLYFFRVLSLSQLFMSITAGYLLILLCQAGYYFYTSGLSPKLGTPNQGKDFLKEYSVFLLFTSVGSIGSSIGGRLDIFMITSQTGLEDAAVYSLAMYLASIIELPQRSLSQVLSPLMADAINNNDLNKVRQLNQEAAVSQLMIGFLLFLLIVLNIADLYLIIPKGEQYSKGIGVVFITGLTKLIIHAMGANTLITTNSKYYKINFVNILLFLVINIVGNYLLIPRYGINGAAFATAISTLVIGLIYFFFVKAKYQTNPFTYKSGLLVLVAGALFLLGYFLPLHFHPIVNMGVRSILLGSIYLWVVVRFNVSPPFTALFHKYSKGIFAPKK